jgi:hypothetical protein
MSMAAPFLRRGLLRALRGKSGLYTYNKQISIVLCGFMFSLANEMDGRTPGRCVAAIFEIATRA